MSPSSIAEREATADRGAFGPVLRRLRLEARLSQEELAECANLSVESISALERGRRRAPYRETVRMISDGLGLSETQRSELQAAAQRPRPPSEQTPVAAEEPQRAPGAMHNLPLQRTSLIGREPDIKTVVRLVLANRLVTLTGTGGIGKTRAALAAADELSEHYAAGVWLIELAPISPASPAAAAIARALHIHEHPNRPLLQTLLAHINEKSLLLVLDNCEHVVGDVAVLADALLQGCPNLHILATSRESLRISGERLYRLPSLRVPAAHIAHAISAADAAQYAAVKLFVARALRSDHTYVLDDRNAPVVAEICRRLDGIPLAIELAAARVNVLPLDVLLAKLDRRLTILTGGDRTAVPRQQTMRALIDWSYDLLAPPEQRLFERLSIFAGGCTLSLMSSVVADVLSADTSVLEILSSLIDKSLVTADLDVPESRYRLLESSRQYAAEKLARRGEWALVAHRHAAAYVDLAERMEREHDVAPSARWFALADLENENWRAALHWSLVERGDVVLGQRLAGAMRAAWPASSITERRRWLLTARELIDERTPPIVAANIGHSIATVAYMFGEYTAALADSRHLVTVFGELGDALGVARAQFVMGRSLANLGRLAEGEPLLVASLNAARTLNNTPLAGLALAGLARAKCVAGNVEAAREFLAEAFEIYDANGADAYSALVHSAAAGIEFRAGNCEQALAMSLVALDAMRSFNLTLFVTMELNLLAAYYTASDKWADAAVRAREALRSALETEQVVEVLWAIQHLAAIAALTTDTNGAPQAQRAARLLGYVDARMAALEATRQFNEQHEYERVTNVLRNTLGAAPAERSMQSGASLSDDEAIEAARAFMF